MLRSTVNTIRNFIFEAFLKGFFYLFLYTQTTNICSKQHAQSTLIYEQEEQQNFANQKAEQFLQSAIKRILFVATKQHLKESYITIFTKFYNSYIKGVERARSELNEHPPIA